MFDQEPPVPPQQPATALAQDPVVPNVAVDKGKILVVGGQWKESRFRPFADRGYEAIHVDTTHWGKNSAMRIKDLIKNQKLVAVMICQGHISHAARDVAVTQCKLYRARWMYVHKATEPAFHEAIDKIEGGVE